MGGGLLENTDGCAELCRVSPHVAASLPAASYAPMSKTSVFCIATSRTQADYIIEHLEVAKFSQNSVSALFSDRGTSHDFAHEMSTKAPEGAVAGVSAGGFIGGVLGWIAGIGVLAIPGAGPFLAAGPIMAALSGAAIGAAVGGVVGGFVGLGVPELEAKRYEGKIEEGNILISVHTDTNAEVEQAKEILSNAGAQDICSASESVAPKARRGEEWRFAPTAGFPEFHPE